ncbi:hypothetical protein [Blastococcus montanus]|uniref:hypothetical protein n=1 Tax=Blastococcus montanus TaxID=3144973 RepID=UPI003207C36D
MSTATIPYEVRAAEEGAFRLTAAALVLLLVTQRLVLPTGGAQIPFALPVIAVAALICLRRGRLGLDRQRLRYYSLSMVILLALSLWHIGSGREVSLASIGLLLVTYATATLTIPGMSERSIRRVLRLYVNLMVGAGAIAVGQFALQYLGIQSRDWLASVVPPAFLLSGYNTGDPISYGADIIRSNGVLFVEPSFLSLFVGVAFVVCINLRAPGWKLIILGLAVATTVAGNGVVVIIIGLATSLLGRQRRNAVRVLILGGIVFLAASLTPLAGLVVQRVDEIADPGSSSSQRLVEPYDILMPTVISDAATFLFGQGAGVADDIIAATGASGVLAPVLAKLLVEYGAIGTAGFLLFIFHSLGAPSVRRPWAAGILVAYFFVNAALLQYTLATFAIILLGLLRPAAQTMRFEAGVGFLRGAHRHRNAAGGNL